MWCTKLETHISDVIENAGANEHYPIIETAHVTPKGKGAKGKQPEPCIVIGADAKVTRVGLIV